MSIEVTLIYDGCGKVIDGGRTAKKIRDEARSYGAKVSQPGGKDFCPGHWWACAVNAPRPEWVGPCDCDLSRLHDSDDDSGQWSSECKMNDHEACDGLTAPPVGYPCVCLCHDDPSGAASQLERGDNAPSREGTMIERHPVADVDPSMVYRPTTKGETDV